MLAVYELPRRLGKCVDGATMTSYLQLLHNANVTNSVARVASDQSRAKKSELKRGFNTNTHAFLDDSVKTLAASLLSYVSRLSTASSAGRSI